MVETNLSRDVQEVTERALVVQQSIRYLLPYRKKPLGSSQLARVQAVVEILE